MLFSSVTFLFTFLPLTLILYYISPKQLKNVVLLVASLIFYAWGEPVYIGLMVLSILFNFVCGKEISDKIEAQESAKFTFVLAVVVNLLLLGFFKYFGLFLQTFNDIFSTQFTYHELSLPIGISFYTFQAISYLIDVYRKQVKSQNNVLNFALYIAMFPQLIAGPIVRYIDIEKQLKDRSISLTKFGVGVRYFIFGFVKKVVLANGIGAVFTSIQGSVTDGNLSVLTAWAGALAYALQIYFDFSGYSDMAIGLGRMFGFTLKKNFDYPYISKSITEFWRRWHISLGTWFKEYVYIPLGGNRHGVKRQIINLFIVWSLTGFWHGASWNFLFWGFYYGLLLVLEKFVWGKRLQQLPSWVQHVYTMVIVVIGWVFFFSENLTDALHYLTMMFGIGASGFIDSAFLYSITSNWLLWIVCIILCAPFMYRLSRYLTGETRIKWGINVAYLVLFFIAIASLITETFNPFLYFRF